MRPRRIHYSADELAWIKARSDRPRKSLHADFVRHFNRPDVSRDNIQSLCKRHKWTHRAYRPPITLSETEAEWLKAHRQLKRATLHARFCDRFKRTDISVKSLQSLCSRYGWKKSDRPNRGPIPYSDTELAWIQSRSGRPRAEIHADFVAAFKRADVKIDDIKSLCKRKGWKADNNGRFARGQTSWNKGKSMPFNPNSAKTQFKPGQLPHNTRPAGHERLCKKDGYVWMRIEEPNPYTGAATHYVAKHRYLWEKINGPVPEGHALKCLDGDRTNTDPGNWKLVVRGLLPRLNSRHGMNYDSAPAELKPTIMATAELENKLATLDKS